MSKHAVALRAFDHLDDSYAPGPPFPISAGHLIDWRDAGLVREATAAEVAKAKGDKPTRAARGTQTKRVRKAASSTSAKAAPAVTDTPPAGEPDPAAPAV